MTPAPVNVLLQTPTISIDSWEFQAPQWTKLNRDIGGNPDFYPLTIKAFYIIGTIFGAFKSVSILLENPRYITSTYYSAYSVFSSAIDLLGRCLIGNEKYGGTKTNLQAGFQWLATPAFHSFSRFSEKSEFIKTPFAAYSISDLIKLRHFTVHGQAATNFEIPPFDYYVLDRISNKLPSAMEAYWLSLLSNDPLCNNLAKANINPFRYYPIWDCLWLFSADANGKYQSVREAFGEFDWTYKDLFTQLSSSN